MCHWRLYADSVHNKTLNVNLASRLITLAKHFVFIYIFLKRMQTKYVSYLLSFLLDLVCLLYVTLAIVDGIILKYYLQSWGYDLFYQSARQSDFSLRKKGTKSVNLSIIN